MSDDSEPEAVPIKYTVRLGEDNSTTRKVEVATIRESRDRLKQIALFFMGRAGSEPKAEPTSIKLTTHERSQFGLFDFDDPLEKWTGKGSDITALRAVLDEKFAESGTFLSDPGGSLHAASQALGKSGVPAAQLVELMKALVMSPDAQSLFATTDAGKVLADAVNLARRRAIIEKLESVALDPGSSEADLQKALEKDWWIFGGRFVDLSKRRALTVLDQLDVPLIRNDGALHVIELKKSFVPDVIVEYRNHTALGVETARAINQAANYLRALDEQRAQIKADFGIETRRASATVVIGHTTHVGPLLAGEVEETFRTFASQLSRIELITYDTLIAGAKQALALDE